MEEIFSASTACSDGAAITAKERVNRMTIQSPFSVEQCRALLQSTTVPESTFGTMFLPAGKIIGKFSGDNFRLRQKKSYNNSFAPFFFGKLSQTSSGTEISGKFRMHPFVVAFMALWLGMVVVIGGTLCVVSLGEIVTGRIPPNQHGNVWLGVLIPMIMLIFGIALVSLGKWLGKRDEAAMTRFLQETFAAEKAAIDPRFVPLAARQKTAMTGLILFFAALGLVSILSSLTGISHYQSRYSSNAVPQARTTMTHFSNQWERTLAFSQGLFLLLMAYGTWKRFRFVWPLGFVLIGFSAITFVVTVLDDSRTIPQRDTPMFFALSAGVGGLLVGGYWSVWWYRKREEFSG